MDAREWATKHGLRYVWAPDGEITDHVAEFDGYDHEPETCEWVALMDEEGNVLASLSCIDDADDAYRRTVEADLMEEVAPKETTCGTCGRSWFYPTPASRCPFEYDHEETLDPVLAVMDMIRGTLPDVRNSDVYMGASGDALIWAGEGELIHISTDGSTSTLTGEWTTGWDA